MTQIIFDYYNFRSIIVKTKIITAIFMLITLNIQLNLCGFFLSPDYCSSQITPSNVYLLASETSCHLLDEF